MEEKKIIFSGIQPTGVFTLGNYIGAIKNWGPLQEEYHCIYSVVNQHAITVRQDPATLRRQTYNCYALLMACGIDPQKSLLFVQGHNPAHAQLAWILNCYTMFGELSRMTQFKDKSAKNADNINAGLFTYPSLMAADILLYGTHVVPVGIDQKQHLELARDIATRFNSLHGDTFVVPDGYIATAQGGAKIMSLSDPTSKMSKSDKNPNGFVSILDDKDTIVRKFKKAVTDSDGIIAFEQGKDGICNLLTIYSVLTGTTIAQAEREFAGKGYGDFKLAVGEAVADHLQPIRDEYERLVADKEYINQCILEGGEKARRASLKMMRKVEKKVGFYQG